MRPLLVILLPTALALPSFPFSASVQRPLPLQATISEISCPLPPKIDPDTDGFLSSLHFIQDNDIRERQVDRLSRAVQVDTSVGDSVTDPEDEGFAPFVDFQDLLRELFPLVHQHAKLDHINTHALLYTLPGTSPHLQPILFLAHQDVVPIDDPTDWTYPPFSGHYDGTYIWGRGASDCKNTLIGLLSAIEDLLSQGFKPSRTVIFSFGFDEESHGFLGAGHLAPELEKRYGKDSIALILDEGGNGVQVLPGDEDVVYALPAVGEKGSLDLALELAVPGGHSSIPPAHTGIGIIADIIHTLERKDLFVPELDENHPTRKTLECQVVHSPEHIESWLGHALSTNDYRSLAEKLGASRGDNFRVTLQTTQATDIIHGGVKSNALPEKISAVINYRVALHQKPDTVISRAVDLITPIMQGYNLSFSHPYSSDGSEGTINHLTLRPLSSPLVPAPLSPTDVSADQIWARFSGVARAVFESVPALKGKKVVVSGDVMTGNTDTRFYWNLSRNIYRWNPSRERFLNNIHTVDEKQSIDTHLEGMMMYYDLIRAFDQWDETNEFAHEL
ncbi:Gly-Xaa carboxypeptidase [Aspergillus glaucus CBS 516.65]|uniref:Peptidase M20 dimerisation domain-containing protein n=1 Tax=Aspergillus glaucus CBS 516.65 TaxID=1160497 RepID=A0A1L9VK68_ASPGL|nr:hypothetical protein ASPGLDRAFT_47134 [Aspergillus glaucus CBS 516.65]OJJ84285.1 hypothetical protein ASPGLDRAFT_47134 [Aspergillus glaucus CBS 516.65]